MINKYKSWVYPIIVCTLVVVIGWQNFKPQLPEWGIVNYAQAQNKTSTGILEARINARAEEIYTEREKINKEHARLEAIQEANTELQELTKTSPYVDYDHVRAVVSQIK